MDINKIFYNKNLKDISKILHINIFPIFNIKIVKNSNEYKNLIEELPMNFSDLNYLKENLEDLDNKDAFHQARNLANSADSVEKLYKYVDNFDGCSLKNQAIQTVFSDGNPNSDIMLIGEAPGMNEDIQGIPFCGQSGKLLDNILFRFNLNREKVYISNSIFWRPPNNRPPTLDEIILCKPFVEKHISLISPKIIILVGSTAAKSILNNKQPLSTLRGTFYNYVNQYIKDPIPTVVIYHPSYLLRQPKQKKLMLLDMMKIMQFYREIIKNN
ncbi:uracil-DNA glycosylase [Lyticum sinuosum]|uniref:Type-4 uracil-DNA glycosylase n=1 Tax=Lyticum sinuosum TaxID=1332059 RepID=A0AAE4VJT2_9RICK|nr:uracil-DNA glycosylase [Lyticum sinuosum]MDZ5761196.1 Uracil DNA glycosylase superfamily protein [Lyticum sinuosum]